MNKQIKNLKTPLLSENSRIYLILIVGIGGFLIIGLLTHFLVAIGVFLMIWAHQLEKHWGVRD